MRSLPLLNFLGVLALSGICVMQWIRHHTTDQQLQRTQEALQRMESDLHVRTSAETGVKSDLDAFKNRWMESQQNAQELQARLQEAQKELTQAHAQTEEWTRQKAQWTGAISNREARLREALDQIRVLNAELQARAQKYNQLASNYNQVIRTTK